MDEYPNNLQEYNKPRRGCGSVFLGILVAIGILAIIATVRWIYLEHQNPGAVNPKESEAMMPYVVNTQSEVARSLLEDESFVVTGYDFHKSYRKEEWGIVKEQPLEAGKYYPKGTKVELIVWGEEDSTTTTTKPQVAIPNLVGQYYEGDFNSAKYPGLGFRLRKVPSDRPKGLIIRQSISPGTMVPIGTDIFVYYSGGPEAVAMPDAVGWNKEDAVVELESLGLNVEIIEDNNDGNHESGTVSRISSFNNTAVEKGETVILIVWD